MNTLFGNLLDRAERAGAALVICDEHDTIIKANDAHVKIYDCVDYSAMPTFEEFSLRFIEGRKTGNELIYQDPHAWMQAAAQFRRTSDYSQFIARLADGRVMLVCYEKVKDTNNWWYQACLSG